MAATATVNGSPTVRGCVVASVTVTDGTDSYPLAVIVSAQTWAALPPTEQLVYLQCRGLLSAGPGFGAEAAALAGPLATGTAGVAAAPGVKAVPETRNWAALWTAGQILS